MNKMSPEMTKRLIHPVYGHSYTRPVSINSEAYLLSRWYYRLPRNTDMHNTARRLICERCDVSARVFWGWLRGETKIPYLVKQIINDVAGERVFSVQDFPIRGLESAA